MDNAIKKFKCEKCQKMKEFADGNCTICHEEIMSDITVTSCGHSFHSTCLFKWFRQKNSCPLCREKLIDEECASSTEI